MLVAAIPLVLLVLIYVYIARGTTSYRRRVGDGRYRQVLSRSRAGLGSREHRDQGSAFERGARDIYGDTAYNDGNYDDDTYDLDLTGQGRYEGDDSYEDDTYGSR